MRLRMLLGMAALAGLAAPATAQTVFRASLGPYHGTYSITGDVQFIADAGPVKLDGPLIVMVDDGTIDVDSGGIDGTPTTSGSNGSAGYHDPYTLTSFPPTNGGPGSPGAALALVTNTPGKEIRIHGPIWSIGTNGGTAGSPAAGAFVKCPDGIVYPAQIAAQGGSGASGGSVYVSSAGDLYWESFIWNSGGAGGDGGEGGSQSGYIDPLGVYWTISPFSANATDGGAGGAGGSTGWVQMYAAGTLYYTDSIGLIAHAGAGGRGGTGGGTLTNNGIGGSGGTGGTASFVYIYAENIVPEIGYGSGSKNFEAIAGAGGFGGRGGLGDFGSTCGPDCSGALGSYIRGPGAQGGMAGTPGTATSVDFSVPSGTGTITLEHLSVVSKVDSYPVVGGDSGASREQFICGGSCAISSTPAVGVDGQKGGHGGAIYFEGHIVDLAYCMLDARGVNGYRAGRGGDGLDQTSPCSDYNGSDGGNSGAGGDGGNISIFCDTLTGTSGVAYVCGGQGVKGGDGGCPHGRGGAGGGGGTTGTFSAYHSFGTAPSRPRCAYLVTFPGDNCP